MTALYALISIACLHLGRYLEERKWVSRTRYLDICEHATPRCSDCNRRKAEKAKGGA